MPLSRRSLSAGTLVALLAGCAGAPPPASAPPPATQAGVILGPGVTSMQLFYGPVPSDVSALRTVKIQAGCEPNDPMAFDPGPRVDSLAIHRTPGGWVAPMPNACPVDARFQLQQPSRYVTVRGHSAAPKPR